MKTPGFASSDGVLNVNFGRFLVFRVSPEVVEENLDWSDPVRFRFERLDDGTVSMHLQTVEVER